MSQSHQQGGCSCSPGSSAADAGIVPAGSLVFDHKPTVAFNCVHNSCRSQIAEALGRLLASESFNSCSAGTELKDQINQDAVRLVKERFHLDMEQQGQRSKLLSELPQVDIVITMGCNVACPSVPYQYLFDWGLEDPSGHDDAFFHQTIDSIERKVRQLAAAIVTAPQP